MPKKKKKKKKKVIRGNAAAINLYYSFFHCSQITVSSVSENYPARTYHTASPIYSKWRLTKK